MAGNTIKLESRSDLAERLHYALGCIENLKDEVRGNEARRTQDIHDIWITVSKISDDVTSLKEAVNKVRDMSASMRKTAEELNATLTSLPLSVFDCGVTSRSHR